MKLFLDDERLPKNVTWIDIGLGPWVIARNFQEAVDIVKRQGFPSVVSFDHDLALEHYQGKESTEKTGYDFAKWLVEYDFETGLMPEDFAFTVHSMNPIGAENIRKYLNNYLRMKHNDK